MMTEGNKQWKGQSRGGKFGNTFFVWLIMNFGLGSAYFFLSFVVVYFIPFAPKATKAIWKYYRKIHHYGRFRSAAALYRHYFVFGQTLIDKVAIRNGLQKKFRFEFDGYESLQEIMDKDTGLVFIGAHAGCWEAGSAFFGGIGKKMNIVMFDGENAKVREVIEKNIAQAGYNVIAMNHGTIEAMIQIKIALNSGEYVCFTGDRFVDRATAVKRDFLGGEAMFSMGPFALAAKCHVPVILYFAMREKGRKYRFVFKPARGGQSEMMDSYIAALEEIVRKYPGQWFNFFDFWEAYKNE